MPGKVPLAIAFVLLLLPLAACEKHGQAKRDVQFAWEAYRAAAEEGDGKTAAGALSKETREFYVRIAKLALDAKPAECQKLRPSEMAEVAGLRARYSRQDVKGQTGGVLVAMAIKDGNWDKYGSEWKLRDIQVDEAETKATAVICNPKAESEYRTKKIVGGLTRTGRRFTRNLEGPPSYPAAFVKEGDDWKINETAILAQRDQDIRDIAQDLGLTVPELISKIATGERDPKKAAVIWEPMK